MSPDLTGNLQQFIAGFIILHGFALAITTTASFFPYVVFLFACFKSEV